MLLRLSVFFNDAMVNIHRENTSFIKFTSRLGFVNMGSRDVRFIMNTKRLHEEEI